jgi:hypothetical protein
LWGSAKEGRLWKGQGNVLLKEEAVVGWDIIVRFLYV